MIKEQSADWGSDSDLFLFLKYFLDTLTFNNIFLYKKYSS